MAGRASSLSTSRDTIRGFTKHHGSLHPLDMGLGGSPGAHMSQPSFLLLPQYGKPKNFLTFLPPCSQPCASGHRIQHSLV